MEAIENKHEESPKDLLRFAVIAALIIIPIRIWIVQPFVVSGTSMSPNYSSGDYLMIDQVSYYFKKPTRGEVIVFKSPIENGRYLVKRVIGLPNDTVSFTAGNVSVIGGDGVTHTLSEPYVRFPMQESIRAFKLKSDQYFVMGDNRAGSADSRIWGALPEKNIVGRVLFRAYPFKNFGFFPAYHDYDFENIKSNVAINTSP